MTRADSRVVTVAAYAALAVVGFMVGVIEGFSQPWTAGGFPIAAVLICVLNFGLLWLAGWGMGGKLGAVVPAATWLVALMILSIRTPSGSLVITGNNSHLYSFTGNIYLLGGTVAALLAIIVTRSSGNWLIGGAAPRE